MYKLKNLTEELTEAQKEVLIECRREYLKLGVQTEDVRARVNAIDFALKKKEDPIKPKIWM